MLWIYQDVSNELIIVVTHFATYQKKAKITSKETGHLWPYYIYMTVFIRNAANLAHILPNTSRTTFTSEVFL
jgi:hypothetical protein